MLRLDGRVIAITEARRAKEMAEHIAKLGGVAVVAPALREVPSEEQEEVQAAIRRICDGEVHWAIFLTGVGARAVLRTAEGMRSRDAFVDSLNRLTVAARGPKPIGVLREAGIRVDLVPQDPTSEGLVRALEQHDLRQKTVAVQLYGEPNPFLIGAIEGLGARVIEMQPYTWDLPADQEPLERLVRQIIEASVDAVSFTNGAQVHHLFAVATRVGLADELRVALASRVPVAAVGRVTEKALAANGLSPRIVPPTPTMGALVVAMAKALGCGQSACVGGGR